jgi:hypothetical protein
MASAWATAVAVVRGPVGRGGGRYRPRGIWDQAVAYIYLRC